MSEPVRCLLGMLGADVHNKGIRTLAQHLRDRGVEVVYLGEHNTPAAMAQAAIAEDADVVGVSFCTGTYLHYSRQLLAAMQDAGIADVPVMVGGLVHAEDEPMLREIGVAGIFGPGTNIDDVMAFLGSADAAKA